MGTQVFCFARPLHLDDAYPRPDEIDKLARLRFLEGCDCLALGAVAPEELIEEGVGPAPLGALVDAPAARERGQPLANLLAGQRHRRPLLDDELPLVVRDREVRPLHQSAMLGGERLGAFGQCFDHVFVPAVSREGSAASLSTLPRLGDV